MKAARNILWVLIIAQLSATVRAEDQPFQVDSSVQPTATIPLPQQPEVDMPTAKVDRSNKGGQANAAALAGAAMAGATCMMMLNEARKTGDKMMMMMALQQCAQAAQSAANAGQNKDGSDASKADDGLKAPKLGTMQGIQAPKAQEPNVAAPQKSSPVPAEDWNFDSLGNQDPITKDVEHIQPDQPVAKGAPEDAFKTLEPINTQTSTFDGKKDDGGVNSSIRTSGVGQLTLAQARNLSPEELRSLAVANAQSGNERRGVASERSDSGAGGDGGGSSSNGGGGGEGSGSPLDAMLAQLMGGGAGADMGGFGFANGSEIILYPDGNSANGGKRRNIFEFASDEYKFLAHQKGRVRSKMNGKQTTAESAAGIETAQADTQENVGVR